MADVPPLFAMRGPRFIMPAPINRGREVPFENLQAGRHYYFQRDNDAAMNEFEFLEHLPGHQMRVRYLPRLLNVWNHSRNPLPPIYEPRAPGYRGDQVYEAHAWPHYKFYEVSQIKRKGRFINPAVTSKLRRQILSNVLAKGKLPTEPATGPGNTIREFVGWQKKNFTKPRGGRTRKVRHRKF